MIVPYNALLYLALTIVTTKKKKKKNREYVPFVLF